MKKRFLETLIRIITALIAAAVFFVAAFSLPAFADQESDYSGETMTEDNTEISEESIEPLLDEQTEESIEEQIEELEPEESLSGFIAYSESPEAEITDSWQLSEEYGDDTEKSHDNMRLMDTYTYDASFEAHISAFPDSYKDALRRIHTMYPNFTFVADRVDMSLDEAVRTQIEEGYKTYRSVFTDDYDTIYTFMNPLTYLYPEYDSRYDVYSSSFDIDWHVDADFFMFADHAYSSNQYEAALQYLVDGCDFLEDEDMASIITASAACQMNPYVMASTVILEKGWHAKANGNGDVTGRVVNKGHVSEANVYSQAGGSSILASFKNTDVYIVEGGNETTSDGKTWVKIIYDYDGDLFDSKVHGIPGFIEASKVTNISYFNTYYNLFSVNQSDENPVVGGIAYAMSHGWTSLALSFEGGARFCKDFYYDNDQTTYYYMHYNVLDTPSRWWHEYSTGVSAGLKCARILRYGYDYDHDQSLVLKIPVYDSDPEVKKINGVWTYVNSKGKPDYSYNGIASNDYGTWFIRNGVVDFNVKGVVKAGSGWYYFEGGKVQISYTGIKKNSLGWWRIVNGKVDFNCTSVEKNEYGWWYIKDGKVQFDYTGIAKNQYGWWKIENGKVNFDCTDVQKIGKEWLYISGGKVQYGYTGIQKNRFGWWRIVNGKVDFTCNSIEKNEYGWWYLESGKVNFNYTGVAKNSYGWWRVENGKVNFAFTGLASNSYGWWYLKDGKVDFSYQGIVRNSNGYWYVKGGQVQFSYTGIAQGQYGSYYIENGRINWNYTGTYTDQSGKKYNIIEGEVR